MNKKIILVSIFIFSMIAGSIVTNPTIASTKNMDTAKIEKVNSLSSTMTTGTIPGTNITYTYGDNTFDASDSFNVTNNGTAHDSYKEQRIQTLSMDLVNLSSIVPQKYIFRIHETTYINGKNTTRTFVMDNNTYQSYVITHRHRPILPSCSK